ncbi:hypothetical protein RJG79_04525 [Mycoplasmatota bacterium WC44]
MYKNKQFEKYLLDINFYKRVRKLIKKNQKQKEKELERLEWVKVAKLINELGYDVEYNSSFEFYRITVNKAKYKFVLIIGTRCGIFEIQSYVSINNLRVIGMGVWDDMVKNYYSKPVKEPYLVNYEQFKGFICEVFKIFEDFNQKVLDEYVVIEDDFGFVLEKKIHNFLEIDRKLKELGFRKTVSESRLIRYENKANEHIILFCESLAFGEVTIAFRNHPEPDKRYFNIRSIIRGDINFDNDEYLKKDRCCLSNIENELRFLFEHYDTIFDYKYCRLLYESNDYYRMTY